MSNIKVQKSGFKILNCIDLKPNVDLATPPMLRYISDIWHFLNKDVPTITIET